MPARIAGICGLAAFVTVNIGWIVGGFAQPAAYSVANDDISDLGAVTADSSWIYNRIGANLTGLLVVALALGFWRALSPGGELNPGSDPRLHRGRAARACRSCHKSGSRRRRRR